MKSILKNIIGLLSICIILPFRIFRPVIFFLNKLNIYFYSEWKRHVFNSFPSLLNDGGIICPRIQIIGGKYITIGKQVMIHKNSTIYALDKYKHDTSSFKPSIIIGDNCDIGEGAFFSAINKIVLHNGVLLGRNVTIVDNSHGNNLLSQNEIAPNKRPLFSKGPIVIEENVWIGEKAIILPDVTIGRGSIIGANSVVTKNIPSYCIAAGNPARVIKFISNNEHTE